MLEGTKFGYIVQMILANIAAWVAGILNAILLPVTAMLSIAFWRGAPVPSTIVITGATSGIGRALALEYAAEGKTLVLVGRNADRLEQIKTECEQKKATVVERIADVRDEAAMKQLIEEVHANHSIDLVIANAGVSEGTLSKCFDDLDKAARTVTDINISGVHNTVLPAIDAFRQSGAGGQIAIVSSQARLVGPIT